MKDLLKKIYTTFKATILTVVVMGILVLVYLSFGSYSEGYRAGIVYKISKRGLIFKTYEGEMNTGNYVTTESPTQDNTLSTKVWEFSVASNQEEVIKQIENAVLTGKRVKLFYKQKYIVYPWQGETGNFIYSVEFDQ